jgi:hypothetical protein
VNRIKDERKREKDEIQLHRTEITLAAATPVIAGELARLEKKKPERLPELGMLEVGQLGERFPRDARELPVRAIAPLLAALAAVRLHGGLAAVRADVGGLGWRSGLVHSRSRS